MHDLTFRIKRAHWAGIKVLGGRIAKHGLTPARFDLLYVIRRGGGRAYPQKTLRKMLGVSRMTVSRMVRRLVEIGLLRRQAHPDDRRTWALQLTRRGRRAVWISSRTMLWREASHRAYATCFVEPTSRDAFGEAVSIIDTLGWRLRCIAERFGDVAAHEYPDVFELEL